MLVATHHKMEEYYYCSTKAVVIFKAREGGGRYQLTFNIIQNKLNQTKVKWLSLTDNCHI